MRITACVVAAAAGLLSWPVGPASARDRSIEKQVIITITQQQIDNGILSELAWDGGMLTLQGIIAKPDGQLSDRYYVVPQEGIELRHLEAPSQTMVDYWQRKSRKVSPTGLGTIVAGTDNKVPMNALGGLEATMSQASDMGGMSSTHTLQLGRLVIHTRKETPPYDGETYSWSPARMNRIAYVDKKGDLWVASAEGKNAERLLKGNYTLPAWSDDGRVIAVAERKDMGKRWEISLVHVPEALQQ